MASLRVKPLLLAALFVSPGWNVGAQTIQESSLGAWTHLIPQGLHHSPLRPLNKAEYSLAPDGGLEAIFHASIGYPPAAQSVERRPLNPGRAFLLSALLPGVGQRTLGQDRWVLYLAGELWAWAQFMERRREGRVLQDRYRELAWLVARRVSSGPRVDGNFEYYESMTKYQASGAYDLDPDETGIQPEVDPETFNGSMWALARQIFSLDDPENPVEIGSAQYTKALRYYISRAYTPDLAWNWSSNTLQHAEFKDLIRASDENLRRSTTMIGVILANHLLSAVDALVSGRLLQEQSAEPTLELGFLPGPLYRDRVYLTLRLPAG